MKNHNKAQKSTRCICKMRAGQTIFWWQLAVSLGVGNHKYQYGRTIGRYKDEIINKNQNKQSEQLNQAVKAPIGNLNNTAA